MGIGPPARPVDDEGFRPTGHRDGLRRDESRGGSRLQLETLDELAPRLGDPELVCLRHPANVVRPTPELYPPDDGLGSGVDNRNRLLVAVRGEDEAIPGVCGGRPLTVTSGEGSAAAEAADRLDLASLRVDEVERSAPAARNQHPVERLGIDEVVESDASFPTGQGQGLAWVRPPPRVGRSAGSRSIESFCRAPDWAYSLTPPALRTARARTRAGGPGFPRRAPPPPR
jgi:hypothetical protein